MANLLHRLAVRFRRDQRGAIALLTAICLFPVIFFAVGLPIDEARQIELHSNLQSVSDAATLAGSEDIALGGTAKNACDISNAFMTAGMTGVNVSPGANAPTITTTTYPGTSCLSTPQTTQATAPYQVTANITANTPATFLAIVKPLLKVSVTAMSVGPQGFITICVAPNSSGSADINQLYYYLLSTDGTLHNEDASKITRNVAEGLSGGVNLSQFLVDDVGNGPSGSTSYCDAPANTQPTVLVKVGLGQRLGFEMANAVGGLYPCYYAQQYPLQYGCLKSGKPYAYSPKNSTGDMYSYYQTNLNVTPLPNAYGSTVGQVNRFYSTDYPASEYTDNTPPSTNTTPPVQLTTTTPAVAQNSCYFTILSNVLVQLNGYSGASQSCLISTLILPGYGYTPPASNFVRFESNASKVFNGSGTDLVCLVKTGATTIYPSSGYTTKSIIDNTGGGNSPVTIVTVNNYPTSGSKTGTNVQQENLVIANSNQGANVFECPTDKIGDPYNIDPTCSELAGGTIQDYWNDMGGADSDTANYGDEKLSYSCNNSSGGQYTNSVLDQ
jgi:Flp pilus assembly protein TadG